MPNLKKFYIQISSSLESLCEFIFFKDMCENVFLNPCQKQVLVLKKKSLEWYPMVLMLISLVIVMLNISYMNFVFVYLL